MIKKEKRSAVSRAKNAKSNTSLIVKKRSGRLEPFDSRKMARSVSRAGVSYPVALQIAKTIRNDESVMQRGQISSLTLRKIVAEELVNHHQDVAAKSYLGYKKTRTRKEKYRSHRPRSNVRKQTKSHAKQYAKDKNNTGGRPPRW